MSHFTVYKTAIRNLNEETLKAAVELFVQQLGADAIICTRLRSRYWREENMTIGFKTRDMPNGIGFRVDEDGALEVCGDAYGQDEAYNRFAQMAKAGLITNSYFIAMRAQQMRARVNMEVQQDRVVMEVETP